MRTKRLIGLVVGLVLSCLCSTMVYADEVEDVVKEAMEFYKQGDYSSAAGNLEYAAQLIRQKKGGQLESILPKALPGWTAEDASSQAMGAAMFGGGVTAERSFAKGDSRVTVQIVTDSPMLQGLMMLFSNPAYAMADGGKLERINGQKAIVKYGESGRDGDIKMIIANRFLVSVEGSQVSKDDLKAYAKGIDLKKLSSL
ncbi:outer membrane protein assembly factor BamD [Desulfogranum mediterraneum]|uniref:hypothetical protein n=1 Tax=Desulfogranum mediterraneum TaxID=160661 RepID=UPI0004244FB4|nr:hypothetical protein [Desulfogranum mediterraneum]